MLCTAAAAAAAAAADDDDDDVYYVLCQGAAKAEAQAVMRRCCAATGLSVEEFVSRHTLVSRKQHSQMVRVRERERGSLAGQRHAVRAAAFSRTNTYIWCTAAEKYTYKVASQLDTASEWVGEWVQYDSNDFLAERHAVVIRISLL